MIIEFDNPKFLDDFRDVKLVLMTKLRNCSRKLVKKNEISMVPDRKAVGWISRFRCNRKEAHFSNEEV